MDLTKPLQQLQFLTQKKGEATLFSGQHRIGATKALLSKHLAKYQNLQSSREGNQHNDDVLWAAEKTLYDDIFYHGTWAVSVYDLGGATMINA